MSVEAFGYVGVTGKGQLKGHGPERQRQDIAAFAKRNGFKVIEWYDDAHTGTEEDRPQFMVTLERLMTDGVKVVIVESLDRFARDMAIQSQLLAKLLASDITLIPANTGHELNAETLDDNPMLKAMARARPFDFVGIFSWPNATRSVHH